MVTSTVFAPSVSATLNGTPIVGVRKARVISTFSDPVTKIYVSVYPAISWSEGDMVTVTMGSGTNNVLSGTGQIYEGDYLNAGPSFELVARGPLFKAQRFTNNVSGGLTLTDLTGGPATDKAITQAVLTIAGVTYNPSDIGGTGFTMGTLAPTAFTWKQGETALAYLQRLSKASLGYRLVETIGGAVTRVQVVGRPSSSATYSLTQGVDIFSGGHTQFDAFGRFTSATVTGYDYGDGNGAVSFTYPTPATGVAPYPYSSEMIERPNGYDLPNGMSSENMALYFVLPEVDRIATRVSGIKTPRDDVFQPGQTHQITADWLGLNSTLLWCMGVTRECDDKWFTQTMEYIGGGSSTVSYIKPYGQSTFLRDLPRGYPRMRDYTHTDRFELELIGQDSMTTGDQLTPYQRPVLFPQQPWQARAHLGLLGVVNAPI